GLDDDHIETSQYALRDLPDDARIIDEHAAFHSGPLHGVAFRQHRGLPAWTIGRSGKEPEKSLGKIFANA
ncbi:MAG: hypothetical protein J0J15_28980, partial [Mesorhizobium sp.]|nr:hypothetical protein [Mesorhizobium sp.]